MSERSFLNTRQSFLVLRDTEQHFGTVLRAISNSEITTEEPPNAKTLALDNPPKDTFFVAETRRQSITFFLRGWECVSRGT